MVVCAGAAEDRAEYDVLVGKSLNFAIDFDLAQAFGEIELALDLSCIRDDFEQIIEILISDLLEHF